VPWKINLIYNRFKFKLCAVLAGISIVDLLLEWNLFYTNIFQVCIDEF
jgi:hypothetical protein